ncbi:hypothetical protein JCM16418_4769 [Paenibacillus pini JCM 16418]|uniref:Uncharacterized protein n=1 Tax=Paenibacillus pini JCM 16418 TaxID=1236976 RepID=W7YTP3_9BACL|nr:hypothetical protein JCM16418_4769 [Paenibacillus pini JCM 16418]
MISIQHFVGILMFLAKMMPLTYCIGLAWADFYAETPMCSKIVIHNPLSDLIVMAGFFLVFQLLERLCLRSWSGIVNCN